MNPQEAFSELGKADNNLRIKKEWEIVNWKSIGGEDVEILSVKHLSDDEIFTVGDIVVKGKFTKEIYSLFIDEGEVFFTVNKDIDVASSLEGYKKQVVPKLKGTNSYLSVGGHIPCAFYSLYSDWWWYFDENKQKYILDHDDDNLEVEMDDLKNFEILREDICYLPFYNNKQIEAYKNYLLNKK
jgi:hypothetical protein